VRRLDCFDAPKVKVITGTQFAGVASAPTHAHTAEDSINGTPQLPKRITRGPAAITPKFANDIENALR
jgi:hypothetical protein